MSHHSRPSLDSPGVASSIYMAVEGSVSALLAVALNRMVWAMMFLGHIATGIARSYCSTSRCYLFVIPSLCTRVYLISSK